MVACEQVPHGQRLHRARQARKARPQLRCGSSTRALCDLRYHREASRRSREEEISAVLEEIPAAWRDLFATAIYTGMRKGELLGLRKSALDFEGKNILIAASYERETTKGGHADLIPMADAIVPILRRAASQSSS